MAKLQEVVPVTGLSQTHHWTLNLSIETVAENSTEVLCRKFEGKGDTKINGSYSWDLYGTLKPTGTRSLEEVYRLTDNFCYKFGYNNENHDIVQLYCGNTLLGEIKADRMDDHTGDVKGSGKWKCAA